MLSATLSASQVELIHALKNSEENRADFFMTLRPELKRLVRLRLDPRLKQRIDESDVVQEAYVRYLNAIPKYLASPSKPPTVWVRHLVRNVISKLRRSHLETQARDIRREMTLQAPVDLQQLSDSFSSAGSKLAKQELREVIFRLFSAMSEIDREVLAMIHLEGKTVEQVAAELDIKFETARKRYRRAVKRLSQSADLSTLEEFL